MIFFDTFLQAIFLTDTSFWRIFYNESIPCVMGHPVGKDTCSSYNREEFWMTSFLKYLQSTIMGVTTDAHVAIFSKNKSSFVSSPIGI
jgi:hypothetical protein